MIINILKLVKVTTEWIFQIKHFPNPIELLIYTIPHTQILYEADTESIQPVCLVKFHLNESPCSNIYIFHLDANCVQLTFSVTKIYHIPKKCQRL